LNTTELKKNLDATLDEFKKNVNFNHETSTQDYCNKDDLNELAKQTFYALGQFENLVITYLQDKK